MTTSSTNTRAVLAALSGLLLAVFVSIVATSIVATALPSIVRDLDASQSIVTWVVVAEVLAMTVTVPLWGSCADSMDNKNLVRLAMLAFAVGTLLAAMAPSWQILIFGRILQGIGAGGLSALAQIVLATLVAPRQLGRYQGYFGSVYMVAAVSGPLLGGLIVSTPGMGWRYCFWLSLPASLLAMVLLERTLRHDNRGAGSVHSAARVDWLGATVVTAAVSALLVWVTLAGQFFPWMSWPTAAFLVAVVGLTVIAVTVEKRAVQPVLPLDLFRNRTVVLATLASVPAGMAMFSGTVFLAQYFQTARGLSAAQSGLLSVPFVIGLLGASTVSGQLITKWGRWKLYLVLGCAVMPMGAAVLAVTDIDTPYAVMVAGMVVFGIGIGLLMQNLVIAAQNAAEDGKLGATTSFITFFRTLGGSLGVTVLGAIAAAHMGSSPHGEASASTSPEAAEAMAGAVSDIYAVLTAVSLMTIVAVVFIRETPLRDSVALPPTTDPTGLASEPGSGASTGHEALDIRCRGR